MGEHHICKGIYPSSSGAGQWEFWLLAGSFGLFNQVSTTAVPYLTLSLIYGGANVLVHTMWPYASWAQWHTMHHTVFADVYNVNIPSAHDEKFSKDFAKLNDKLKQVSAFVRLPWLSDALSGMFFMTTTLCLHHVLGWSVWNVWDQAIIEAL